MTSSASFALRTHLRTPRTRPLYSTASHSTTLRLRAINFQQRRKWSLLPDAQERRLKRLLDEANNRAHDPEIQAVYLRALGRLKPDEVVRRVELGKYAAGDNVIREYVKALVKTGAIERVNLPKLIGSVSGTGARTASMGAQTASKVGGLGGALDGIGNAAVSGSVGVSGAAGLGAGTNGTSAVANALGGRAGALWANGANGGVMSGTAAAPLHVALAEPSMLSQLWRTVSGAGRNVLCAGISRDDDGGTRHVARNGHKHGQGA
ncbi:ATP-dependent zinc metalloprotease FTSH 9, chloroplastic/mitochondrial [Gracilariopsis chorda]|uniref:ATP-dependent zinc metalloprotease FTSH 9, chloroplastic/mitochondrial n=1 Tax=Gracilariopsis chorda TaxID=448386 RepID=A0A2V3J6P4_9FLOR|nr:ATP-dependent zinc metalloprotease FTSH 9, chloroplastic/mitochondrial [Gracilariopsis chorda]|eukprot:PXF50069.1 ATP-dependent zinc metalloprotease FTSH 9, chloroplastic/mitochondrial [Gracilariopsis chorda]